jgi:WD repeat-containing protein 61
MPVTVHKLTEYTGHKGSIFAMALSADERYLYSSGDDGVVARWDLHKAEDSGEGVMKAGNGIYSLLEIPAHNLLAAGGSDGTVHLVDLTRKEVVHTYRKTPSAIFGFYFEARRDYLWVLHGGGALSVLRLPDGEERGYQRLAQDHLRAVAVDPEHHHLYLGASDNHIRRFDLDTGTVSQDWEAHENSVFSLALHHDNHYLLSGGRDAHFKVWDLQNGHQLMRSVPAHNFTVNDIAFSPTGDHFVTASRDKTFKLWDAYEFELLKVVDLARYQGHSHSVNRIKWLKADNSVISCSDDRRLIRWRLDVDG